MNENGDEMRGTALHALRREDDIERGNSEIPLSRIHKKEALLAGVFVSLALVQGWAISDGGASLSAAPLATPLLYASYAALIVVALIILFDRDSKVWLLTFAPIAFWLYSTINTFSDIEIGGVLIPFELALFSMLSSSVQARCFTWYRRALVVVSALGIVAYLSYILNLPVSYKIVDYYYLSEQGSRFVDYGFSYLLLTAYSGTVRLCGVFNEPGYFGTILALVLIAEDFDIRKPGNLIMVVSGIMTLSMAFVFLLSIGLLISFAKNGKRTALVLVVLGFILLCFSSTEAGSELIDGLLSRVGLIGEGGLDNRTTSLLDSIAFSMSGANVLFGYGDGAAQALGGVGNAGIKATYVDGGLVGLLLLYLPIIVSAFSVARGNRVAHILIICLILSIYQRSNIYILPYFIVIFGGIHQLTSCGCKEDDTASRVRSIDLNRISEG